MKTFNLNNFIRGWLIGDFEPSIIRTKDFEVTVKRYKKGNSEAKHLHKKAVEITIAIDGVHKMNDTVLKKDTIVLTEKNEAVRYECVEDGALVVVKIPSVIGDKYVVET